MASEHLSPIPEPLRESGQSANPVRAVPSRGYDLLGPTTLRHRSRVASPLGVPVAPRPQALDANRFAGDVTDAARRVVRASSTMQLREAVHQLIAAGGPTMVYQPQLSLSRLQIAGYEALARFPGEAIPDPEHWFRLAHDVGLGAELESCALANALRAGRRPDGTILAVNLSPSVLDSMALREVLPLDLTGIEVELTEYEAVADRRGMRRELDRLRERGARLAIDDVGAGHSSLRRVMELSPDSLKLDRELVEGVAGDTAKIALIRSVVDFAAHIGASVCAEGVERLDDLLTLADLDVEYVQGWAVGIPHAEFGEADPCIVDAARGSRRDLLTAAPGVLPVSVDDLGSLLADITDLASLTSLVASAGLALECDSVRLSTIVDGAGAAPAHSPADQAALRTCLVGHQVIPLVSAGGGDQPTTPAVLLAPVVSRGEALGLIECVQHGDAPFSRRQIRAARLFGRMIGPVLDGLQRA